VRFGIGAVKGVGMGAVKQLSKTEKKVNTSRFLI
jgi:hypothetical protein